MPSSRNGGNIKFGIDFEANQASLNKLKKSLQDLQKIKLGDFKGSKEELQRIQKQALQVEKALNRAFNPTLKTTNISAFKAELESSGITIKQLSTDMASLGPAGVKAFGLMSTEILTTNLQLKETNSLVDSMGKTMINTVKWGIASSVMNTFTQSVQSAFQYVQSLEKSLTNIRIVTGDSTERMTQFAEQANRSAQALGRSTLDYTKASLTYYQQGLNDEDVQARTEATLKAQNITGAGSQMADYLTSVWNGYKVANEEAELYVDKLAAVADSSASDMSQLAIAMSKVASTANSMGVDVDQLNAQIATVVATTRQAPESVGTAFKTIYTRMNDIKAGTEDAEISLGRYSGKMAELGFNVLDATGHLRDTGQVMEEIGDRWQTLTREQQVYLAQTMGGQRQVNQLMALFDNWTTYSELLNTSLESEGTLTEKNARYMESLGAKMEQLGAAGERVKASLVTADMINPILTGLTGATNLLGLFIESIGGGTSALLGLASGMMAAFGPAISREINNVLVNIQNTRDNLVKMNEDVSRTQEMTQLSNDLRNNEGLKTNGQVNQTAISNIVDEVTKRKQDIQQYYGIMQAGEVNAYNAIVKRIGEEQTQAEIYKIRIKNAEDLAQGIEDLKNKQDASTQSGKKMLDELSPDRIQGTLGSLAEELKILSEQTGVTGKEVAEKWKSLFQIPEFDGVLKLIPGVEELKTKVDEVIASGGEIDKTLKDRIKTSAEEAAKAIADLDGATLNGLKDRLKDIESELQKSQKEAEDFVEKMQNLSAARTLTQMLQGTTQLMSGMSSLGGVIDNVFNKKMSAVQKFTKTIMGLGYSIPSIIAGFNKLQTTLSPVIMHFSKQNTLIQATNKLQEKNNILKAAQTTLTELQAKANTKEGVTEQALAVAKNNVAIATKNATIAQQELNTAMMANPVTLVVMGILALTAALTVIPKIYDAVTTSADQAKQAIQNFNNAQKESTQKYAQAQEDVKTLSGAEDEWNRLSKAAGDYNSTIDNLTEEEKERYYELSNLIASYNSAAVIGYDAHGNAIINKNTNLREQIQLINQAAQAERRRFYNSDEYRDNVKGQKVLENEAKDNYQASNQALSLQKTGYANTLKSSITAVTSELIKDNGDQARIDEYNKFLEASEEEIVENEDRILQMLVEDENALREKYGNQVNFNIVAETKQAGQDYKDKVAEVESNKKQMQKASQLNYSTLFDQLSLNSDAYNQLKELGITNVEGLITSYIEGAGQAFSRANLGSDTYKTAADKINNDLLQSFVNSVTKQQNGKQISINELFGQFIVSDQAENGKEDWTFRNLQEKSKVVSTQINKFLEEQSQETIDAIKAASGDANMEKVWEEYFANLLNVDKVKIDFNTGEIEKVTSEALERLNNKVKESVKAPSLEGIDDLVGKYLRPDLSESQLDFINKKFTELNDGTRSWSEALQQAQKQMFQLSLASNSSESIGLLNKKASGEDLSDEEQQQLKSTLQDISNLYPSLRDEVALLNNEWLKGTSAYENALRNIKDVLLNSLAQARDAGNLTIEETMGKAIQAVSSMEDLQSANVLGLFNNEEGEQDLGAYDDALLKIASQYDNCRDEIEKYTTAIRTNNEQLQARLELERASRAAQVGAESGIDPTRIDSLIDSYQRIAEGQSNATEEERKFHQEMLQSSQIAAKVANDYINLNDGIEALGKDYKDIHQLFTKTNQVIGQDGVEAAVAMIQASEEMGKTFSSLKENISDVLGISQDLIGDDWILENAEDIEKAIAGDEEAIIALKDAAFENALIELGIDDSDFLEKLGSDKETIIDLINDIPLGQIDLDTNPAIQALYDLLAQAGYTDGQIKSLLADQGIYIDTVPAQQSLEDLANTSVEAGNAVVNSQSYDVEQTSVNNPTTDTKENVQYDQEYTPNPQPFVNYVLQDGQTEATPVITWYNAVSKRVIPHVTQEEEKKDNTATAMRVSNAFNAGKGGKVSHRNSGGGAKPSSGGKGGGGKKGGGGGKGSQPKKATKIKGSSGKADRYRDNTVKANKLANQMTKLNKQQERLTGKDTLKNLQKQLKILQKQNDTIRERIGLQRDEQSELAGNLKQYGAKFDKDGTLNNYFDVFEKIKSKYDKLAAKWNSLSGDQQEANQKLKEQIDAEKQKMEAALKDLERYDKLQQEIAKSIQQQIDNAQEQIDLQVKQFDLKIKAELDLSEAKRDLNKFKRDVVEEIRDDDILGLNKYRFADIASYYNTEKTGSIQYLTSLINELTKENGENFFSAVYDRSRDGKEIDRATLVDYQARLEQLKELTDNLQGEMEDFKSLVDDVKESIFDVIDAAQDAFDEQMDEYEYIGDLINHNVKITELLYGDQAYDKMTKFYDRIEDNNNAQLDFLSTQKDYWYDLMTGQKKTMDDLEKAGRKDSNLYKESQERFKEYEKHWIDNVNDLKSTVEDALDNIMDKYSNAISNILLNFDLSLGGGKKLDDIADEWDMLNDLADTYLDKINSAYEIEKLQNAFNDAIDDNEGNVAAQQSLNNLMEQQLAYLKDKEKLTQYDVDRANTLLQIEMKRLALEQSRANKNRLRLRRDSQGNYTYQYTADTEAMNKAEQELADARNSLYNSDKAAYVDNLNAIQKSANDIKDKLEDIWNDENLSKEQKLQKSYELQKYYGQKINDLIAENASIRNNLMDSAFEELAKMYGINEDEFRAMSKEQQNAILKDIVPQANSYAADMVENIAGSGGFKDFFQNALTSFIQAQDDKIASIAEVEESAKINLKDIVSDTNIVIDQASQLLDVNDALIQKYEKELYGIQSNIDALQELINLYSIYKDSAAAAVQAASKAINQANMEIVGTNQATENRANEANEDVFNEYLKNTKRVSYSPEWSGSDFAAMFGSANVIDINTEKQNLKDIWNDEALSQEEKIELSKTLNLDTDNLINSINNNMFSSISSILTNILETNQEYYAASLAKQDAIRQAVVANQTIHIDADFPNAKDVSNIIEAIDNLALVAAQRANTTIKGKGSGSGGSKKR